MKYSFQKICSLLLVFVLVVPQSSALDLKDIMGESDADSGEPLGAVVDIKEPVITEVVIQNRKEYDGAVVAVMGKNFGIIGKDDTSVVFPTVDGATQTVSNFNYISPVTLIFPLPQDFVGGSIYVKVAAGNTSGVTKSSKPFHFDFHPPEILFITGEDGVGPGKKVRVWGNYFDGIYYRRDGKSRRADIENGMLKGVKGAKANGELSYIDMTLPAATFQQDFWVERNCDEKGENCLKSNTVSLKKLFPPVLTDIRADYSSRVATVIGKNFPLDEEDFKLSFDGNNVKILSFRGDEGEVTFELPCSLPQKALVQVDFRDTKSNPILFEAKAAPALEEITINSSSEKGFYFEVSGRTDINISPSSACSDDSILRIGSKEYPIRKNERGYESFSVDIDAVPEEAEAVIIFKGIESNPFSFVKEEYIPQPYIYRMEGKFGFRPGTPFTLFGRNLGNMYLACDRGSTVMNGPDIVYEEIIKTFSHYDDDGDKVYDEACIPNRPTVEPTYIDAQFLPLEYGKESSISEKQISITVIDQGSNILTVPFGDPNIKIVQSPPLIRKIEYSEGHLPGDTFTIHGNEFGTQPKYNTLTIDGEEVKIESASRSGTKLTAKIPEGLSSPSKISVTRKTPNTQTSIEHELITSPYDKKEITFSFPENENASDVFMENVPEEFTSPEIAFLNTVSDLKVTHMKVDIHWKESEESEERRIKDMGAAPFDVFSLELDGEEIATGVARVESANKISVTFSNFILPLTEKEEPGILTLHTSILPFVTDEVSFSFFFSPQKSYAFAAKNMDNDKIVYKQLTRETTTSPTTVIYKEIDDMCVDTDEDNSNCLVYMENAGKNEEYQKKKAEQRAQELAVKKAEKEYPKLTHEEKKEAKTEALKVATQKRVEEKKATAAENLIEKKIQKERESLVKTADRIRKTLGTEKAKKVLAILEKQKNLRIAALEKEKEHVIEKQIDARRVVPFSQKKTSDSPFYLHLRKSRVDTDKDGLSDIEEELMGTNPNKADTDRDGYSDFLEVEFGFPPAERRAERVMKEVTTTGDASPITRLYLMGLFDGLFSDSYGSEYDATRMMFVVLLGRVFFSSDLPEVSESSYKDVSRVDWYLPYLVLAEKKGISLAGTDTLFRPMEAVTRGEACEMIVKAASLSTSSFVPEELVFHDTFSSENASAVAECVNKKLLLPTNADEGIFGVKDSLTRGEMARILYRTITSYK